MKQRFAAELKTLALASAIKKKEIRSVSSAISICIEGTYSSFMLSTSIWNNTVTGQLPMLVRTRTRRLLSHKVVSTELPVTPHTKGISRPLGLVDAGITLEAKLS